MVADLQHNFIDYNNYKAYSFLCMGGLCEVLIETVNKSISDHIFNTVLKEARRIESKFSRYQTGNIVYKINNAQGKSIKIDRETYHILQFADSLHKASFGLFDITSGVLRRVWTFDGRTPAPAPADIAPLLKKIDWKKVSYNKSQILVPKDWELDFGGLVKEYSVDFCIEKVKSLALAPTLINFGGDIAVTGPKINNQPWKIHVDQSAESLLLFEGAVATSGDKNRYVIHHGVRLGHIINPKTGWPIVGAPRSVTVAAKNCTQAGALATLSLLKGSQCEEFLKNEADVYKIIH